MTTTESTTWVTEPFIMGSPEQFTRLREWLNAADYTEPALCAKTNVRTVAHLKALGGGRTEFVDPADLQSLLVMLFLDGESLPWEVVRSTLGPDGNELLDAFGLLVPSVADPAKCVAPIALFPTENVFCISDRLGGLEVNGDGLPADLVYSPLTAEAARYIGLMPRNPCDSYLEICGGTGIAALLAAKQFAKHAVTADITERSTRFAEFNGLLNGLDNYAAVIGDLYEPVKGQTFDVIAAHPPYVPAESTLMVYRDGGNDGEQITRRIVAGLDEYLRPGGLFYLDCVMTDRSGSKLEDRIRRMLGAAEDEFDVVLLRGGTVDPKVYQADRVEKGLMTPDAMIAQQELFKVLAVEQFVQSTVLIQRRTTTRPVVTRHRMVSGETRAPHLEWLMRYLTGTVEWGLDETRRLLDCSPRALATTELRVRSALKDGVWTPIETKINSMSPFAVTSPCPAFLPTMLSRCDGKTTAREHLTRLRSEGLVPASATDDDFAQLIRELADGPYLELELFPLPDTIPKKTATLA